MSQSDEALAGAQSSLDALKRNPVFPFANYQADIQHYMFLEMFFAYLFKTAIGGNAKGDWQAWYPPAKEQDGNPIFTAINLTLGRGVRIIQNPLFPATTNPSYFPLQPYLSDSPAEPFDSDKTILVLGMLADPSPESEAWCAKFCKMFCVDLLPEAAVEAAIRQYEDQVGMLPA